MSLGILDYPNTVDELVDKGIHLASAFQLAGFRHVTGTLWKICNIHCVDAARMMYETIRDEGITDVAVCRGPHLAIRKLGEQCIYSEKGSRDAKLLTKMLQRGLTTAYQCIGFRMCMFASS